ncbi:MAG: hypothetical protein WD032_00290 [Nitrospirales bacterium]
MKSSSSPQLGWKTEEITSFFALMPAFSDSAGAKGNPIALENREDRFDELFETFEECREPNWDGYGAQPVCNETYRLACEFLTAFPGDTPAPSVGAEPDGHLTVEWYRSPERTLSVSISADGNLHFAALLGVTKAYGTEPFVGEVPKIISDLIHRVTAT